MISYRDMTFCSSDCTNITCPRNYSEDQHVRNMASVRLPVSMADFSDDCPDYIPADGSDLVDENELDELGVVVE